MILQKASAVLSGLLVGFMLMWSAAVPPAPPLWKILLPSGAASIGIIVLLWPRRDSQ